MIIPLEIGVTKLIGRIIRFREGHQAVIYILVAKGTKDEAWLEKALMSFDSKTIEIRKN